MPKVIPYENKEDRRLARKYLHDILKISLNNLEQFDAKSDTLFIDGILNIHKLSIYAVEFSLMKPFQKMIHLPKLTFQISKMFFMKNDYLSTFTRSFLRHGNFEAEYINPEEPCVDIDIYLKALASIIILLSSLEPLYCNVDIAKAYQQGLFF